MSTILLFSIVPPCYRFAIFSTFLYFSFPFYLFLPCHIFVFFSSFLSSFIGIYSSLLPIYSCFSFDLLISSHLTVLLSFLFFICHLFIFLSSYLLSVPFHPGFLSFFFRPDDQPLSFFFTLFSLFGVPSKPLPEEA